MQKRPWSRRRPKHDGFARIAFWQFMAFLILLLVIWVDETLDLSALWFDTPPHPFNVFRGCVLSALTILAAVVAVGLTYEQQKRIIRGLLTVCAQCRKIRVGHEVWEQLDDYIASHSVALISHGLCPDCFAQMQKAIKEIDHAP
jgi:hypothetical protein